MGMVQSKKENSSVYKVGCLGKISDYQKSKDGRILINLTGITRFKILTEIKNDKLYREFKVDYKSFENDLSEEAVEAKTEDLMEKAKSGIGLEHNTKHNYRTLKSKLEDYEKQLVFMGINRLTLQHTTK